MTATLSAPIPASLETRARRAISAFVRTGARLDIQE
jgi:hypothetical protein